MYSVTLLTLRILCLDFKYLAIFEPTFASSFLFFDMRCETKLWLVVLFFLSVTCMQHSVLGEPQVPCHFIFGDSLSDCGNNNKLSTSTKVNYLPYGIDFPAGPTGRFTNGRTAADFITQLLGLDNFIPPFANTSGSDILKGVNYASGAAGIRNETGTHMGEDINLEMQLQNHKVIVSQIAEKLGSDYQVQKHLNKCLYYLNIGSNDYINNYYQPKYYPTQRMYSPEQYAGALVQQYSMQLKALHSLGARKFALIGLSLIGCIPMEISRHGKNGSICADEENKAALLFNRKLKSVVERFNKELSDAKFIFVNSALISSSNPQLAGDKAIDLKCCKVGSTGLCVPDQEPCKDRNLYAFFDAFHPTESANKITAMSYYKAPIPSYTYPTDISHLVSS